MINIDRGDHPFSPSRVLSGLTQNAKLDNGVEQKQLHPNDALSLPDKASDPITPERSPRSPQTSRFHGYSSARRSPQASTPFVQPLQKVDEEDSFAHEKSVDISASDINKLIKDLAEENDALFQGKKESEDAYAVLSERKEELEQKLELVEREKNAMAAQFSALQGDCETLNALNSQAVSIEQEKARYEEQVVACKVELEDLERAKQEKEIQAEAQSTKLQENLDNLNNELMYKQQYRNELETQCIELQTNLELFNEALASKKQEADAYKQHGAIEESEASYAALEKSIETTKQQIKSNVQEIQRIDYAIHLLTMPMVMLDTLVTYKAANAQNEIKALKDKLVAKQDLLATFNQGRKEAEKLEWQIAILNIKLEVTQAREQAGISILKTEKLVAVRGYIADLREQAKEKEREVAIFDAREREIEDLGLAEAYEMPEELNFELTAGVKNASPFEWAQDQLADINKDLLEQSRAEKKLHLELVESLKVNEPARRIAKLKVAEIEISRLGTHRANEPSLVYDLVHMHVVGLFEKVNIALQAMLTSDGKQVAIAKKINRLQIKIEARVEPLEQSVGAIQKLAEELENCLDQAKKESRPFDSLLSMQHQHIESNSILQKKLDIYYKYKNKVSLLKGTLENQLFPYDLRENFALIDIAHTFEELKKLEIAYPNASKTSDAYKERLDTLCDKYKKLVEDGDRLYELVETWHKSHREEDMSEAREKSAERIEQLHKPVETWANRHIKEEAMLDPQGWAAPIGQSPNMGSRARF